MPCFSIVICKNRSETKKFKSKGITYHRALVLVLVAASGCCGDSAPVLRQFGAEDASAAPGQGVCLARACSSLAAWTARCRHCVVLLGTLQIALLETTKPDDFYNITFPNLREVTEFVVVYRVAGLHSLGQLFPNLARIRGRRLLNNYALVIHDVDSLTEIGLYGLTRIDRGGVVVWGVHAACSAHSVGWERIAPRGRVVLPARPPRCPLCRCDLPPNSNYCWNNKKCQIYLEGAEADVCHAECLGCRKTRPDECSLCRHFTYRGKCLSKCPSNTLILPDCHYCLSHAECLSLEGWAWNGTCVFHCPRDYAERTTPAATTCVYDPDIDKSCESVNVWAISAAQEVAGCARVLGALEVHVRRAPSAMEELRAALGRLREVEDYIYIYGSATITSLDFLPSLRRIGGRKLKNNKYSVLIHDMPNLQTLFTSNVTRNLTIDRGTMKLYNNPRLCSSSLRALGARLPAAERGEADLPLGMNGYGGECGDAPRFQLRLLESAAAVVMFSTLASPAAHYSVLYARLPRGSVAPSPLPEACSAAEWHAVAADAGFGHQFAVVELTSLRPASTYAICIEIYDPVHKILARTYISNFTTPVGKPEPSFLLELAASNSSAVLVRWLDHEDYLASISHYELDVSLLDIHEKDVIGVDQCKLFEYAEVDASRHAVLSRPPAQYARACEAACGRGAGGEEYFDVCGAIGCDGEERAPAADSDLGRYVRTRRLRLAGHTHNCTVGGLAPYRDYRFRLRACAGQACSRSVRGVVRTRASRAVAADVPGRTRAEHAARGRLDVQWSAPEETNGPILSYSVEMKYDLASDAPQTLCVPSNVTRVSVDRLARDTAHCWVRVCARSLASDEACGAWLAVEPEGGAEWWWGACLGACCLAALACRYRRARRADRDPLLAATATFALEDPPTLMLTDFPPMYDIPLRDSRLS